MLSHTVVVVVVVAVTLTYFILVVWTELHKKHFKIKGTWSEMAFVVVTAVLVVDPGLDEFVVRARHLRHLCCPLQCLRSSFPVATFLHLLYIFLHVTDVSLLLKCLANITVMLITFMHLIVLLFQSLRVIKTIAFVTSLDLVANWHVSLSCVNVSTCSGFVSL